MPFPLRLLPAPLDALDAPWMHEPVICLALAAVCLLVAVRHLKRALFPIGALIQAAAAAAVAAAATSLALGLLIVAAVMTVR